MKEGNWTGKKIKSIFNLELTTLNIPCEKYENQECYRTYTVQNFTVFRVFLL
jgi:hypothetical protein